jgi:hypothetical protein
MQTYRQGNDTRQLWAFAHKPLKVDQYRVPCVAITTEAELWLALAYLVLRTLMFNRFSYSGSILVIPLSTSRSLCPEWLQKHLG